MKLPAIKNYYSLRRTLNRFSWYEFDNFTEIEINILFSIHCIETEAIRCTKTALYNFMSANYHTPNKTKLFALIVTLKEKGIIRENIGTGFKFLTVTLEGKLLLSSLNDRLQLSKVKKVT